LSFTVDLDVLIQFLAPSWWRAWIRRERWGLYRKRMEKGAQSKNNILGGPKVPCKYCNSEKIYYY